MFCIKCGIKLDDNAKFCKGCGRAVSQSSPNTKEETENNSTAKTESTEQILSQMSEDKSISTIAPSTNATTNTETAQSVKQTKSLLKYTLTGTISCQEAHELLKNNTSYCQKIKKISLKAKGTILKGTIYNYIVNVINKNVRVGMGFATPWNIVFGIIGGVLSFIVANIGWDIVDGYGLSGYYIIPLILGCIVIVTILCFANKESKVILLYIYETLNSMPNGYTSEISNTISSKVTQEMSKEPNVSTITKYANPILAVPTSTGTQEDTELLKTLINKHSDYYLRQFEKIDRTEKSFNVFAFLFAPIVLLYRKQYSYFFKLILPTLCCTF